VGSCVEIPPRLDIRVVRASAELRRLQAACGNPAFNQPATAVSLVECVDDAALPSIPLATPLREESRIATGMPGSVDNPAMPTSAGCSAAGDDVGSALRE
jgi:hypothetical protein